MPCRRCAACESGTQRGAANLGQRSTHPPACPRFASLSLRGRRRCGKTGRGPKRPSRPLRNWSRRSGRCQPSYRRVGRPARRRARVGPCAGPRIGPCKRARQAPSGAEVRPWHGGSTGGPLGRPDDQGGSGPRRRLDHRVRVRRRAAVAPALHRLCVNHDGGSACPPSFPPLDARVAARAQAAG